MVMGHRGQLVNSHILMHRGGDFMNQFPTERTDATAANNFA